MASAQLSVEILEYLAFSAVSNGGSAAGIVLDAEALSEPQMQSIATAHGAPATCFVLSVEPDEVRVRFFSPKTEYGMCGHGTIALLTALVDLGLLPNPTKPSPLTLYTSTDAASLTIGQQGDGGLLVMLDLAPAPFRSAPIDATLLADALGTTPASFAALPLEVSDSDFAHLILVMKDRKEVSLLDPDFDRLTELCRAGGIETVAPFSLDPVDSSHQIYCRDFCPAVGTNEAAATGTTNRAISGYAVRHHLAGCSTDGPHILRAEQGFDMGRPSLVTSKFEVSGGQVRSIAVGGVGCKGATSRQEIRRLPS